MIRYGILLVVLMVLVAAISVTTARTPRADLTFPSRGSIHTLDPAQMDYMQDIRAALTLWEGLTALGPVNAQAVEGTAYLPPEVSPDRKHYLFTLRPEARWSNGEAVTTADFIRGWRRAIEPGTSDVYAELLVDRLVGAREYVKWRTEAVGVLTLVRQLQKSQPTRPEDLRKALLSEAGAPLRKLLRDPQIIAPNGATTQPVPEDDPRWGEALTELRNAAIDYQALGDQLLDAHIAEMDRRFAAVDVHALDDRHLDVQLVRPTPYFLDLTAFSTYLPVHRSVELLREHYEGRELNDTGLWAYDPQWAKPDYHRNGYPGLITNGPYRLTAWRFKQVLRFEANPYYWRADQVRSKSIDMLDIGYQNTEFLLYEQGLIDWFTEMSLDFAPDLVRLAREGQRRDIHTVPAFGTYYFDLNCRPQLQDGRPNPFVDARVRRALNRAVNKQEIVDYVERLGNPVARTLVPPGVIPGYHSPKGLSYDPELARRELAEAGYPGGRGFPDLELSYNTEGGHEGKVQAVKRMWERELGLKVYLSAKESKTYAEDKDKGRYMVGRHGWFGDYMDPTTFLDLFQSENPNNMPRFKDSKYDAMLARAAVETDPAKRLDLLSQAEAYLVEEQLPIIPIYTYVQVYAWRENLTGVQLNPRLQYPLQYIQVRR